MDEMNKNMKPGTTDQKRSEQEAEGQDNVKIWKKPQTGKKKKYVYEVITEEPGSDNSTSQTGDSFFREQQPEQSTMSDRKSEEESTQEAGQASAKMQGSEAGWNSETGNDRKNTEESEHNESFDQAEQVQSESGPGLVQPEEDLRQGAENSVPDSNQRDRTKIKAENKKKADKAGSGSRNRRKENLLEKDNVSKKARQEFWKQQIVEGTLGQSSPIRRLLQGIGIHYKRIISVILILVLAFGAIWFYDRNRKFHSYDVEWQVSASENSYSEYLSFNGVILHYSQDGVSCINQNGEVMWNQAYNMDVPGIAVAGDYAVIYDIKGTSIYICKASGCVGNAETKKNILKADISDSGVVAVVLDDKTSNYINYFRKDGTQIDLEIKTLISGDGYPLDIAISPNGEQLITSYIYADSGNMLNQVVFRNFEVGKNNADRVVGGFRQYEETLVPEVIFFDDQNSAAITEQSIDFYSTRNAMSPELAETRTFDSRIKSVFYNKAYVGVILEEKEKTVGAGQEDETQKVESAADEGTAEPETRQIVETAYTMLVFDKKGGQTFKQTIDFEYEYADFSGDGIVVFNNSECAVYNMTGVCKYHAQLDMNIEGIMRFGENSLVIHGNGALQKLTLK